jgi:hypothetical protein
MLLKCDIASTWIISMLSETTGGVAALACSDGGLLRCTAVCCTGLPHLNLLAVLLGRCAYRKRSEKSDSSATSRLVSYVCCACASQALGEARLEGLLRSLGLMPVGYFRAVGGQGFGMGLRQLLSRSGVQREVLPIGEAREERAPARASGVSGLREGAARCGTR